MLDAASKCDPRRSMQSQFPVAHNPQYVTLRSLDVPGEHAAAARQRETTDRTMEVGRGHKQRSGGNQLLGTEQYWWKQAREVRDFQTRHARWPSDDARDPTERALGVWLGAQQRAARGGRLAADRRQFLNDEASGWADETAVPEWVVSARDAVSSHTREERWRTRCRELGAFRELHARWPNGNSRKISEKTLGLWLGTQRTASRKGTLSSERREYLDDVAPGWLTHDRDHVWRGKVHELADFVTREGRWPRAKAALANEATLGRRLRNYQAQAASGSLVPERRAILDSLAPGWNSA